MTREQVDVVVAGGASHVVTLTSGLATLSTKVDIVRVGGSSAGAIAAAALAFGVSPDKQKALLCTVLMHNRMKDRSLWPLDRFGIYKGDAFYDSLLDVFQNKTMGEANRPLRVVVCDLWTRQPVVIDSENPEHQKLLVADVLRCSAAIPVFFKAWKLPQWRGNRLFVDGGTAANFALGMFDDHDRRTIGLRLSPAGDDAVKPVKDLPSFGEAIAALVLWASDNAYISKKRYANVICVPQIGSGLDFDLTREVIDTRWQAGNDSVLEALFQMGLVK